MSASVEFHSLSGRWVVVRDDEQVRSFATRAAAQRLANRLNGDVMR